MRSVVFKEWRKLALQRNMPAITLHGDFVRAGTYACRALLRRHTIISMMSTHWGQHRPITAPRHSAELLGWLFYGGPDGEDFID